ncbi:MAG: cell surface protein SprA [Bacteroidales bacterium]|nr:cell surface protein SprA [Bacteroidales bacterium]
MLLIKGRAKYREGVAGKIFLLTCLGGLLWLVNGQPLAAQVSPTDTLGTIEGLRYPLVEDKYPFSDSHVQSPLYLRPPSNIKREVVYDPVSKRYVFTEKVGEYDIRPSGSMSMDEYRNFEARKSQSAYWREKAPEDLGAGPSFLKNLRLGNQDIDKVFGSDLINITPQGSAELIFGYTITEQNNPLIPMKNRKNGSFLFKEKIMMNVTGAIGDKMEVELSYNTEATFNFENKTKLEYAGKEDEIIKKIEAGDISFSLPGSLITGSQSLFGLKTELQFGHLNVTSVMSHQEGESSTITVQGGAQLTEFEIDVDEYDANRHFFLSHFFRDHYNEWLQNLPYIESQLQIQQIEVWVVNKQNNFDESRDIVAFMDLGEGRDANGLPHYYSDLDIIGPVKGNDLPPSNDANGLYARFLGYGGIRDLGSVEAAIESMSDGEYDAGRDYVKIELARPLSDREYTLNPELGYVSLNSPLRNDEILAVAYTFTYRGKTYKVGELSNDPSAGALIVKLLKGETQSPKFSNWDLMMKNVYSIGAYQVSQEKFVLDILYRNDKTGVPVNYLGDSTISVDMQNQPLLKVLELDNLDGRNEPNPDGMFDFVEGVTINPRNGRVYFPVLEPFGSDLRERIEGENPGFAAIKAADRYVFQELYDSTKTRAEQIAEKNKFFLKGVYRSSSSSEIQLNAMNVPRGSVKVTAGGRQLVENQDFTVDYTLGRVKIINSGLMESGTPIKISLESTATFQMQTKTLLGTHLDYRFNENFNIGATVMNLTERPITEKVNMGDEPISNTIWGLNTSYRTKSQLLTTLVDALPFIQTKETSSIMMEGEFAHLIPGQSKAIGKNGIAYIDDFEAAQTKIEMKYFSSWTLASAPKDNRDFSWGDEDGLASGYGRAKLAWYVVDPLFYKNTGYNPGNDAIFEDLKSHYARRVREKEIFPQRESDIPGQNFLTILNLAYYPDERGPYNYNPNLTAEAKLPNPEDNWAGVMRSISQTDFETSNIEFIEFWLMDPYLEDEEHTGGDLFIHLGEISEDVLRDSRKSFEGGLPADPSDLSDILITDWGHIPGQKTYLNTFEGEEARPNQDVGLDGLNNENETNFFSNYLDNLNASASEIVSSDPSGDDFRYYLNEEHDLNNHGIFERYKDYNNLEGNSPSLSGTSETTESNSNMPDIEDVNNDNTLNTVETYFQYRVSLRPGDLDEMGKNYIVDEIEVDVDEFDIPVKWYQFKIPLDDWEKKVGDIQDFKSIRFMRIMVSGFEQNVFLRFATLDLVRGEWRRYTSEIAETSPVVSDQEDAGNFEVSAVNIEENSQKVPVNYILPKGISRVTDPGNPQVAHLNEQSLVMKVNDLEDADARAVFKNIQLDLRQYKNLEMFIHAEALPGHEGEIDDYELSAFIRLGSDYQNNYYEIEVPLELTQPGVYNGDVIKDREAVWPDNNSIEFIMEELVELKQERNRMVREDPLNYSIQSVYSKPVEVYEGGKVVKYNTIKVKGNPNFSNIRQIMLGVRNPGDANNYGLNDGLTKSAEIWFNELRLTDFNNKGGWATNGRVQAQLADFGVVSIAGSKSTAGFGSIEEKVEERSMEDINEFDISSNMELGKFFPEKAKVSIPLYVASSKTIINPEYFPKDPDIKFKDVLEEAATRAERDSLKVISQDHTSRASINLTNIRWNKKIKKADVLSPANISASLGYTETLERNYSTEYNNLWKYNLGLNYVFNTRPKNIQPFKKSKVMRKPIFKLVRDLNFNPYPSRFTFGTVMDRNYQEIKLRNVYEDVELLIEPTVNKDFTWDRKYDMKWDLTRSLKLDYSATNIARIDEPQGQYDLFKDENEVWKEEVWQNIIEGGRNMNFNQKVDISYNVPINKIPFLNWANLNTSYGTNYSWTRGDVLSDETRVLGNTIKNSNTLKITSNLNLRSLYGKVPYLKQLDQKIKSRGPKKEEDEARYKEVRYEKRSFLKKDSPRAITHKLKTEEVTVTVTDVEGKVIAVNLRIINENRIEITADQDVSGVNVVVVGKIPRGENPLIFIADNTLRLLTGFKSLNLSWTRTSGSLLPGYLPETSLFGFNLQDDYYGAPGYQFVMGMQDTGLVRKAIDANMITRERTFSQPYEFNTRDEVSYRASYEPFKGLRIDFTGSRSYSEFNEQIFFYDDSLGNYNDFQVDHIYRSGSFSISTVTLATAFESPSEENNYYSEAFEQLRINRSAISRRLYRERMGLSENYTSTLTHGNSEALYDGYGSTSQEVLIPAFLAAYTGVDPENVTLETFFWTILPNWRLSFDGLSELDFIQKLMKTLSISHSYKSTYSINGFGTNVSYFDTFDPGYFDADEGVYGLIRDSENDYISRYQFNAISIKEELRPLIGLDMTWHNSFLTKIEFGRSRTISMSLNNNQINESRNNDYTLGAGYRFKEVPVNIRTGGQKQQVKSDLNIRLDITMRDNMTVLRFLADDPLVEDDNRVTTGGKETKIGLTADYVFSDRFSMQFFFNRDVVNPYTATTYPTKETSFGFNLRLTL